MSVVAPPAEADEVAMRRLRWHCRRGTKELDLMLLRYVDQVYVGSDAAARRDFERLLESQDPDLAAWLYGREVATDAALGAIIATIRTLSGL